MALARLRGCAGLPELSQFAYVMNIGRVFLYWPSFSKSLVGCILIWPYKYYINVVNWAASSEFVSSSIPS